MQTSWYTVSNIADITRLSRSCRGEHPAHGSDRGRHRTSSTTHEDEQAPRGRPDAHRPGHYEVQVRHDRRSGNGRDMPRTGCVARLSASWPEHTAVRATRADISTDHV